MKKIIFGIFLLVTIVYAEFISSFDEVPPAKEEILGTQITMEPSSKDKNIEDIKDTQSSFDNSNYTLNDEVNESVIEDEFSYKEVKVEDLLGYGELKIALLVPKQVIKGYAQKVSNTILSYLIYSGEDFTFEVFDSKDESEDRLYDTISKIKSKGYKYVIAPLTKEGAQTLASLERDILIYVPTINKKENIVHSGNFYFGGIDYKKQIKKLMSYTNGRLAVFMDKSYIAQELTSDIQDISGYDNIYVKLIQNVRINPKYILKGNNRLQNASIFFNMPLISTALLASSFSSYNIKPFGLFSTQVNYSPLLFTMIQRKDRQNFYIANSIGYVNSKLNDINQNLGIKIKYDWVAYASSIGMDYILSHYYAKESVFNEEVRSHQVLYRTKIEKIVGDEFQRVH